MKFLSPEAFAFLAALPIVVVFYLLKRKRVVKLISSTVLWQRFLAETQASAPFQRLRHNWLLVLQLILLTLVVLALTRPFFAGESKASRLRVVILDASASMQSTDEKPSRFEKARAEALKWVDGLRDLDQMIIVQAGAVTEVKQSATTSKAELRRALEMCQAMDSSTRLGEALKLAETLIRSVPDAEIHLFSDGATPSLLDFENKALPVIYHRVGLNCRNLGVVSLDVRANPDNAAQRAVFSGIYNPMTNEAPAEVELLFDGRSVEKRTINIAATNTEPMIFIADQTRDGVFTVRINTPDDLASDNQCSMVSLLPKPIKILLASKGNRFLEKALRGVANTELATVPYLSDAAKGYDIVVLDGVLPGVWPEANMLAIQVHGTNWFESVSQVPGPPIVDWRNNHPLLRYVNFDNVQVSESVAVKTPSWGVSLVDSPTTPLMIAGELNNRRVVWLGFDTVQSTWPLRLSFPIFVANAVEWLNPAAAKSGQYLMKAGDTFRLTLAQPVDGGEITKPDHTTIPLKLDKTARELVFSDTVRQGIYRLKLGTTEIPFCANLMDPMETATAPRDVLPLGKYDSVSATTLKRANLEIWRWIAAVGLLVLMFEWWFYHKRTV